METPELKPPKMVSEEEIHFFVRTLREEEPPYDKYIEIEFVKPSAFADRFYIGDISVESVEREVKYILQLYKIYNKTANGELQNEIRKEILITLAKIAGML
ncbi:hypothetical protein [Sulfolobus spindle-shaped virus]|nr:hypothetical protein [Sulfolobus spindle-shaped virus]